MSEFEVDAQGRLVLPDFAEVKKKLAENMKAGILGSLPDAFFDQQVEEAFKAMTEPRPGQKSTGDERCGNCKRSTYSSSGSFYCPHNLVTKPSEIQELIQEQMRKHIAEKISEFAERWVADGITDEFMISRLEALTEETGRAFVSRVGALAVHDQLTTLRRQVEGMNFALQDEKDIANRCPSCGRTGVTAGNTCDCGVFRSV